MLQRSFVHLPGIGPAKEQKLWDLGVESWSDLACVLDDVVPATQSTDVEAALQASFQAFDRRDLGYFHKNLPRGEMWRLVPGHTDDIAYLDIETTGLHTPPLGHSTSITFYFRGEVLQETEHAAKERLIHRMQREARIWCTFNGACFDLPFLSREFRIEITNAHIDLRVWLSRLGIAGGLKKIQKAFAEIPQRTAMDITGYDAVRLWRMHESGMHGALETLLTYNAEDTIVLEPLLVKAFNMEVERRPQLALTRLVCPDQPVLTTRLSSAVYAALGYDPSTMDPP